MKDRILYIVNADWYFQLHWLDRAKAAKNAGFSVSVATPITDTDIRREIELEGIKVIPWAVSRSGRNLRKELQAVVELGRIVKAEDPSIVHSITVKPNFYTLCIAIFINFSFILSVTGLGMLFTSTRFFDRLSASVVKLSYAIASRKNAIFFENNDDLHVIKRSPLSKAKNLKRVKGAGVSAKDYEFSPIKPVDGSLILFFAARLLKPKGLDVLVDAVKNLDAQGYNVELRVAGISDPDSPLSISKEQIEVWSRLPFFEFLGNRKDVPRLIKEAHFVCLPSTYGEGIPRILIEAAAMGRPLITTDVPGCREICQDQVNGFLVPPGESTAIVESMKGILKNTEKLDQMGRNSKKIFDQGYASEKVIAFTLDTYRKALSHDRA